MIIKGKNINMDTDYYNNSVTIDMDVDEIDTEEVIELLGSGELLSHMKTKDISDFLEIYDILESKKLEDFFENNEYDMMSYLIDKKGENWILEHISDDSIIEEHRDRVINDML